MNPVTRTDSPKSFASVSTRNRRDPSPTIRSLASGSYVRRRQVAPSGSSSDTVVQPRDSTNGNDSGPRQDGFSRGSTQPVERKLGQLEHSQPRSGFWSPPRQRATLHDRRP